MLGYYYAAIIASLILYANTVSLLKKIRHDKETIINTLVGSACSFTIILSILSLCSR